MTVTKFTGTGFTTNALNLDFLRDEQGNPLKTPNSFLVLHNPVRQKCNDIIDQINDIIAGIEIIDKLQVDNLTIDNNSIKNITNNNYLWLDDSGLTEFVSTNGQPLRFSSGSNELLFNNSAPTLRPLSDNVSLEFKTTGTGYLFFTPGSHTNFTSGDIQLGGITVIDQNRNITGVEATFNKVTTGNLIFYGSGEIPSESFIQDYGNGKLVYNSKAYGGGLLIKQNTEQAGTKVDINFLSHNGYAEIYASGTAPLYIGKTGSILYSQGSLIAANTIIDATVNENYLTARMASGIADQGGLIIDQNSFYRARMTVQSSGYETGSVNLKYEKVSDKTPGNGVFNLSGFSNMYLNGNIFWHGGNDGSGSGLEADLLDGQHASDFANKNTNVVTASTLTAGNWYRIAKNGPVQPGQSGGNRATAKFTVLSEANGGYHEAITFYASVEFGTNPSITLLNCSNYSTFITISKIRLVHGGTYEGAAIEVYISAINAGTFTSQMTDNIHYQGWSPVSWEIGEVPAGFNTTEVDISTNNALMSTSNSGKNVFELTRTGTLSIGNSTYGTLKLKGGASGISSVYLYNGSTLSGLFRHTPSAGYMEMMNYVPTNKPYVRLYDSGAIDLGTYNSNDIRLIAGGKVKIDNIELLDSLVSIDSTTSSQVYLKQNGTVKGILQNNNVYLYSAFYNYTGTNNGIFLYDTGKTMIQSTNTGFLEIMTNNAGTPILLGSYASGRKASLCPIPLSDTVMAMCAVDRTSIGTKLDLRIGHFTSNCGIYYDVNTGNTGFHNDTPSERLDVNGYINSVSGLKIGTTEVLNSNRKGTFNNIINTGTRRSGLIDSDYFFEDLIHYSSNLSSITGAFVIQTSIPFAYADMLRVKIDGYNYTDTNCIIDLIIAGYAYTSNLLIRHGYINNSIKRYSIRSARQTSTGNLALIIGETSDVFSYPKLKVSACMLGYYSGPDRAENWTISILSDLSAYDNLYSITEASGYVLKGSDANINSLAINSNIVINSNRTYTPPSIADASVSNNCLYYSSDQSKLCYKDYGGTVHVLY